jgi:hypothetical protein
MHVVIQLIAPLRQAGAKLGPYVLLELLLPGGTLFALLLFLHHRVKAGAGNRATPSASPPVVVSAEHLATSQCDGRPAVLRLRPALA